MDRSACVARRTRLQTDLFFNNLLNQSHKPKRRPKRQIIKSSRNDVSCHKEEKVAGSQILAWKSDEIKRVVEVIEIDKSDHEDDAKVGKDRSLSGIVEEIWSSSGCEGNNAPSNHKENDSYHGKHQCFNDVDEKLWSTESEESNHHTDDEIYEPDKSECSNSFLAFCQDENAEEAISENFEVEEPVESKSENTVKIGRENKGKRNQSSSKSVDCSIMSGLGNGDGSNDCCIFSETNAVSSHNGKNMEEPRGKKAILCGCLSFSARSEQEGKDISSVFCGEKNRGDDIASVEDCREKTSENVDSLFSDRNEEGSTQLPLPKKPLSGAAKEKKLQIECIYISSSDSEFEIDENVANRERCKERTTNINAGSSSSARNEEGGIRLALAKKGFSGAEEVDKLQKECMDNGAPDSEFKNNENVANKEDCREKTDSGKARSSFFNRNKEGSIQSALPKNRNSDVVANKEDCREKATSENVGSFSGRNEEGGIHLTLPNKGLSGGENEDRLQNDYICNDSPAAEFNNNEKVCHLDKPIEYGDEVGKEECGRHGGFSVKVGEAHEWDSKIGEFREEVADHAGLQFSGRKRKKEEDRGKRKGGSSALHESRFCSEEGKKKRRSAYTDAGSPVVNPSENGRLNCSRKKSVSMAEEVEGRKGNASVIGDNKEVCEEEKVSKDNDECRITRKQGELKNFDILKLVRNSVSEKEGKAFIDNLLAACEKACEEGAELPEAKEKLPLKFTFGYDEPEPAEKSEFEKELDELWTEMEFNRRSDEMCCTDSPSADNEETNETGTGTNSCILCGQGKHDPVLDEEIGIKCQICGIVILEIRCVSAPMEKNQYSSDLLGNKNLFGEDASVINGFQFQAGQTSSAGLLGYAEGTVWDMIPDIRKTMYAHQKEGFEFIWKNLAGTIDLDKLKSMNSIETGGCIISHAPGTGKTRLTMVFLQTYLQVFKECKPVIIAPASILLTWEEEFRKWNIGVPFYNLNNMEFTDYENKALLDKLEASRSKSLSKDLIRLVKVFLWSKKTSILGISYSLFEKLAGEKFTTEKVRKRKTRNEITKTREVVLKDDSEELRKALLDLPGLLVLDEGHTPRNQRSRIWKVLSKVLTEHRIILSGTPFQNNFLELYNTLCLARPSFPNMIPTRLKKFCQKRWSSVSGRTEKRVVSCSLVDKLDDEDIKELKALMAPFVHVHKGSILQESLPGLRDCVVLLDPPDLQKELLNSIDRSNTTFDFEHKLAVGAVHPWLFRRCTLSKKEESVMNRILAERLQNNPDGDETASWDVLEKLKLDPSGGAKTRFLIEFVRLTEALNEKVLVFSQFIDPLAFIIEQLNSVYSWTEGKQILHMHGRLDQRQRQTLINVFNDPNTDAKILLASTRACSEGIHLVGASRVVLLDVVWNPSVERQAISRAYRLGQKRVVYTYHLMISGTPESDKYCKQALKDRISELVFSSAKENGAQKNSAVFEDRILDKMVSHCQLKDMIEKIIYQPKESDLVESFSSPVF